MEKVLHYNDAVCEIYYLSEEGVAFMELKGSFTMDQYKNMFNKFLECIVEHKAKGFITDHRNSKGGSMEMRGWLVMKWMPELKKQVNNAAFKIAGINVEKYGFKKFISDYLEKTIQLATGFDTKAFTNVDDALTWMRDKK